MGALCVDVIHLNLIVPIYYWYYLIVVLIELATSNKIINVNDRDFNKSILHTFNFSAGKLSILFYV